MGRCKKIGVGGGSGGGREGGPMRGLELIMSSQGQWEASKKTEPIGKQTDRHPDRYGDSMTELGQWGRFSENTCLFI